MKKKSFYIMAILLGLSAPLRAHSDDLEESSNYSLMSEEGIKFFYEELNNLSQGQRESVKRLIKKVSEKSWLKLVESQGKLKKLGKEVDAIHPMLFLAVIYRSQLGSHLRNILADGVKRHAFINGFFRGGFGHRMRTEKENGNLMRYMPGFSHCVDYDQIEIEEYIEAEDWGGLLEIIAR